MKHYPSIYIPISVEDRLPEKGKNYHVISEGVIHQRCFTFRGIWVLTEIHYLIEDKNVTHWLEKQDSAIVVTKEELVKMFYAGEDKGDAYARGFGGQRLTCEEYLNQNGIKL
jgi:hypothetical protein